MMDMDDAYLVGWNERVCNAAYEPPDQKLKLALRKRQIISQEKLRLHKVLQSMKRKDAGGSGGGGGDVSRSGDCGEHVKLVDDDPFIRFYLSLYRKMCGRKGIKDITDEAFRRWSQMKRKPKYGRRKKNRSSSTRHSLAWGLAMREDREAGASSLRDRNKVQMALMKNRIVAEEISRLCHFMRRMRKTHKSSPPFVKIYLNVFRELCGKSDGRAIKGEAIKRWSQKSREKMQQSEKGASAEKKTEGGCDGRAAGVREEKAETRGRDGGGGGGGREKRSNRFPSEPPEKSRASRKRQQERKLDEKHRHKHRHPYQHVHRQHHPGCAVINAKLDILP